MALLRFRLMIALLAGGPAAGCGLLGPSLPAGTVTGVVLYNGEPAAGKRVSLLRGGGKTVTDANGRYRFTGVSAGRYWVSYVSDQLAGTVPNEVATWQSAPFDLEAGGGRELPPFDAAYNGLLYPDVAMSLIVDAENRVPFHWSPHPQAKQYRLILTSESGFAWTGEWTGEPTAVFAQKVDPGRYHWSVEIDGFERGRGTTRTRQVDF